MSLFFICANAIAFYKVLIVKKIATSTPFVSNQLWLSTAKDPDGYSINFESATLVSEGTLFSD